MSDTKISALPSAVALTGAELVPLVQSAANVSATLSGIAALAGTVSKQVPLTGFNITPAAGILTLRLAPAGTLATGTITMPAAPVDNQQLDVQTSQTVTALTVSPNAGQTVIGAPATITVSTPFGFRYDAASSTWYRAH
jgi:hypothetical protein